MAEFAVIADTGPLVAFLVDGDAHHAWTVQRFNDLPAPFLTCEPVLAEAAYLVSRVDKGQRRFFDLLASGLLVTELNVLAEQKALRKLVTKYSDQPMSLADACLVRLSELRPKARILTLDGHFRIYRRNGRQAIPTIMPD